MNYGKLVSKGTKALENVGLAKFAKDLALILDKKEFQIGSSEKWEYETEGFTEAREKAFGKLCAAFLKAGLELPRLEKEFYEVPIHDNKRSIDEDLKKQQAADKQHVKKQFAGKRSKNAQLGRSLQAVMDLFPKPGYGRFDEKKMLAMMNKLIVSEGGLPVRPDYSKVRVNISGMLKTTSNATILIVDDNMKVALETATAIAGWPGVGIDYYFYKRECSFGDLKGDAKDKALSATAEGVLKRGAQIVLMDQGLGDLKGSELIETIKTLSEKLPYFVGNTGGSDGELAAAGALKNCNKGDNISGIVRAIELLEMR